MRGVHFGASLLDLVKAFERVPHQVLVRNAIDHGYNLWMLRLSLSTYRMHRVLIVDGVASDTMLASRGITAGGVHATVELRLLLIGTVDGLYALRLYVHVTIAREATCRLLAIAQPIIGLLPCGA